MRPALGAIAKVDLFEHLREMRVKTLQLLRAGGTGAAAPRARYSS